VSACSGRETIDLPALAPGLRPDPAGYWSAEEPDSVLYPDDGCEFCRTVEEHSFWFEHRNAAIVTAVRRHPPAHGPIFDVGAGNGWVTAALSAAGFPTIAIEPNPVGAANAAKRGLPAVRGSLETAGFRSGTAGAIGLFDVLEHIPDDRGFLAGLARYLRPRGRLYVTVPAYAALWSDADVQAEHQRRYTCPQLGDAMTASGFDVEYLTYFFWWLPVPIAAARVLASRIPWRRRPEAPPAASVHTVGGRVARNLVRRTFGFEIGRIAHGRTVPFGASCLAVARLRE
jgi:SAM-dependent methyltransferase